MHDIRVVVEEIGGFCDLPVSAGDYFELRGSRLYIPPGKYICLWALQAILPLLPAKQRDLVDANDWIQGTSRICCPDPNGMVIYRIERVPIESEEDAGQVSAGPASPADDEQAAEPRPVAEPAAVNIGHMIVDPSVCSGCRACELICSISHDNVFNPALARVQIAKDEPSGSDTPLICRQCGVARCLQVCPKKALSRHPITKAVLVDQAACNGCGLCAEACPFSVVRMHPQLKTPLLCDLCGGDPQCVRRCVTGALWYGESRGRPKQRSIGPQRREPVNG